MNLVLGRNNQTGFEQLKWGKSHSRQAKVLKG